MASRGALTTFGCATVAFILGAPVLVVGVLFAGHASGYTGTCGPYAPDIAAHPCSFETYAENFYGGFSGVALLLIAAAVFGGAVVLSLVGWGVAGLVAYARRS